MVSSTIDKPWLLELVVLILSCSLNLCGIIMLHNHSSTFPIVCGALKKNAIGWTFEPIHFVEL